MPTKYLRMREENEWEGETWYWYIPLHEYNRQAAETLKQLFSDIESVLKERSEKEELNYEFTYYLDKEVDGKTVDTLANSSDDNEGGYFPKHNQLQGRLFLPNIPKTITFKTYEKWEKLLYKGGIQRMFHNEQVPTKKAAR